MISVVFMKQKVSGIIQWFVKLSLRMKIALAVILILVIWGGLYWNHAQATAVSYRTATVTKNTIISTLSESGNVTGSQINISSPGDGVISAVYVKNGDQVTKGQNLFKVESSTTPQQAASAYASYLAAQSALNSAENQKNTLQQQMFSAWDLQHQLSNNGTYSNPDGSPNDSARSAPQYIEANDAWLAAEAAYQNQDTVIAQDQASLTSAWNAYNATQNPIVTAPIDGVITNLSITVGSAVTGSTTTTTSTSGSASSTSSTSTSGGSTVLSLGDPNSLQVKVQASEVDVPQIHVGQLATVTLDALPNETFAGKVTSVDTFGANSSGVVTYNVYITLLSPSESVLPGMTASANIQVARADDALTVPTTAITTVGSNSYVRVMQNGTPVMTPVTTGIASDTDTQITSGLSEGQTIVTSTVLPSATSSTGASPFSALGGRGGFGGGGGGTFIRTGGGGAGGRGG